MALEESIQFLQYYWFNKLIKLEIWCWIYSTVNFAKNVFQSHAESGWVLSDRIHDYVANKLKNMDAYKVRSPVLFLVFNRPDWTWQTFDRIRRARPERLFIAADGPRPAVATDAANCRRVINIVNDIDWDCEVRQCFRDRNLGCKHAVSSAIRWFFDEVEEGIILEDDCVPNDSFFSFCDAMLEHYRHNSRIMHVAGTNYQFGRRRGPASYYFSRYPHIWGWGTWRRAWNFYDLEMNDYPHFKVSGELAKVIRTPDEQQFWQRPFDMCYEKRIDTWDYQWTYTLFKNQGLAVMPSVNLVSNIGFGSEATHTKVESQVTAMATEELKKIIHPEKIEIDSRADSFTIDYNLSGRFQRLFLPGISNLINICMIESRRWEHTSWGLDELFWNEGKIASMSLEEREKFQELVPKLNNDAYMHYWYGLICLKDGWPEKATGEFDQARELGLTHWRVDWCAARAACLEGRIDNGERLLEKVFKNAPEFARTLCFIKKITRRPAKGDVSGPDENGKVSVQNIPQAFYERRKPSSKNLLKSCPAVKVPRNSITCESLFTVSRPESDNLRPEKRLNIVHIGTLERSGGAARVAWRLAKAQLLAGHDAKLLVGRRESDSEFCEELEAQIADNLAAEYRRQGLLYYEFQGSHFLPEHPLVKAADVIHLHNLHGNYFNPFSLLLLGRWKPVVWTLHDMQALTGHCAHSLDCERWRHGCGECPYLLTYPAVEVDQTARLWADKKLIYDHVPFQTIAPSRWLADMTREGAIARHPARVIPNGVDTEVFIPHDKKAARRRLGLPLDGFITGGVAHGGVLVNGWKGGRYSLEAFKKLHERFPDSYYVSVGGNEYYTGFEGHLINLPSVEEESDLAWVYSALDLYLMTSTAESFSLVIIEAMACGVPVLAFATGGVPDLVTSGVNGLVVDYLDQPALNEALLSLAANPQVLAVLAANTRETSCRYYDHHLVTGWYEELYHEYRQRWTFELGRFPRLSFPEIPQPVRTEPFIRALQRIPDDNYENPWIPDSHLKLLSATKLPDNRNELGKFRRFRKEDGIKQNEIEMSNAINGPERRFITPLAEDASKRCDKAEGGEKFCIEEKMAELTRDLTGAMSQPRSSWILSPKRILVINNLYPPQELGGYGRLLCDFANILEKRGHTIQVLTSDTPYLGQIEKDEFNIDRGLLLYGGWQDGVCKQVDDNDRVVQAIKSNLEKVRSIVREFQPELCLLGNIDFLSHMIFSPLLEMRIPVIHHLGNKTPGYSVNHTPQSNLYRLATASRWLRDEIIRQGYPVKDISVVYPGALVKEFRMHVMPALDKLRIAYAGIVLPYKGPHILIEALKNLHDLGVDFSCALAGTTTDVEFVNQLKKFVSASGMEEKIDFRGFLPREQLKAFFARHNVLVFPSIVQEAFGISQVEAMAAGLTVVSSGTGGAKEVIEHGKSGLIFEPNNSESLAQELLSLVENPERWQSIAEGGRKQAIKEFDIERSVDILEQEFSKLISGQRPADSEYKQAETEGEVMHNYGRSESQEHGLARKSPEALYEEARKLMNNDSKNAAIGALGMLLAVYPDYALAHNDLGVLHYGEGEIEKALGHCEEAARLEPQNPVFQKNLADFYTVEQRRVQESM